MTPYEEFYFGATGNRDDQNPSTIRGAFAFFHPTSHLGPRTVVFPGAYIGPNVQIGADCVIGPGAAIGQPGFGYVNEGGEWVYREHPKGVLIGQGVHIGANACIDGGRHRVTMIGDGSKVDNGVHIAHNVVIGRRCLVIANAMVAGSCELGDDVIVNPCASLRDHTKVGERAIIGMGAVVTKDVPAGEVWVGNPARKLRDREEGEGADRRP